MQMAQEESSQNNENDVGDEELSLNAQSRL